MKKIIEGRTYSTNSATPIATMRNSVDWSQPNRYSETLYRKGNGEYFIHGEGGSESPYASVNKVNGRLVYGEKIFPITEEQARLFAKQYAKPQIFDKFFSEP